MKPFAFAWQARGRAALILACAAAGCASIDGPGTVLIPNNALTVSRSLSVPLDTIVAAAAVYYVVDPLAPNWQIAQQHLGADRYVFALTKKRYTTGGDGEAMPILRRRLAQIADAQGYSSYDLIEFTAGIESNMPVAQRVSRGVVQFARTPR